MYPEPLIISFSSEGLVEDPLCMSGGRPAVICIVHAILGESTRQKDIQHTSFVSEQWLLMDEEATTQEYAVLKSSGKIETLVTDPR